MVSTVLGAIWGLELFQWNPKTSDLIKKAINSLLFRNVHDRNSSVSQNECINWIHHFRCTRHCWSAWSVLILKTISSFFDKLSLFLCWQNTKNFFCSENVFKEWLSWKVKQKKKSTLKCGSLYYKITPRMHAHTRIYGWCDRMLIYQLWI